MGTPKTRFGPKRLIFGGFSDLKKSKSGVWSFFDVWFGRKKVKVFVEIKAVFRPSTFGLATEKVKFKIEISLHTVIQCWFGSVKSKIKNLKPLKYLDSSLVFLLKK